MATSSFVGMNSSKGEEYRAERRAAGAGVVVDPSPYVVRFGQPGVDDAEVACRKLARALRDLVEDLQDLNPKAPGGKAAAFMPEASDVAFRELSDLPGDVLGTPEFWRYLALYWLYDVVDWMYPNDSGERWGNNPSNFIRCLPLSLFIRGQLQDSCGSEDRAILGAINDIDVWTSHVVAVLWGSSPAMVAEFMRALSAWQDPMTGEFSGRHREDLRELAKLIRQARSNVVFDLIDQADCAALVESILPSAEEAGRRRFEAKQAKRARAS